MASLLSSQWVFMPDYSELMQQLGYFFKDESLLQRALTHRSVQRNNNERLEFLGDAVLSAVIAEQLFKTMPLANEGQLSRVRSSLVNGEVLADLALEYRLNHYLHVGRGEVKSRGMERRSTLEDAFEALIGAIYLDGGWDTVRSCVLQCYESRFETTDDVVLPKDAKSTLQEWTQARALPLPVYEIEVTGKAHQQTFVAECQVDSVDFIARGVGMSRRKAEQAAAQKFLDKLNEE